MNLDGKTLLLTGATGGLGHAIAPALAARGARLVLSSTKPEELERLAAALPGDGHRTTPANLIETGAPERLITEAGELDGFVANAGMGGNGRIDRIDADRVEAVMRLNFEVPILMARAIAPALRERGHGHLVFIASLAAKASTRRHALYAGTKAGLRSFAIGLRDDLGRHGVGVSVVSPGFIREAGMFAASGEKPPMNLGTSAPEEVGAAVVEAIERDRLEVDVAPWRLRAMANFTHRRPAIAERVVRRFT